MRRESQSLRRLRPRQRARYSKNEQLQLVRTQYKILVPFQVLAARWNPSPWGRTKKNKLSCKFLKRTIHSHTHARRDHCINSFLKILSISSSHTNGHPAVVPMVTALNHAVADGGRAGGLNLSSSILSDYWERGRGGEAPARCLPSPKAFGGENSAHLQRQIDRSGASNFVTGMRPFFQRKQKKYGRCEGASPGSPATWWPSHPDSQALLFLMSD